MYINDERNNERNNERNKDAEVFVKELRESFIKVRLRAKVIVKSSAIRVYLLVFSNMTTPAFLS